MTSTTNNGKVLLKRRKFSWDGSGVPGSPDLGLPLVPEAKCVSYAAGMY